MFISRNKNWVLFNSGLRLSWEMIKYVFWMTKEYIKMNKRWWERKWIESVNIEYKKSIHATILREIWVSLNDYIINN